MYRQFYDYLAFPHSYTHTNCFAIAHSVTDTIATTITLTYNPANSHTNRHTCVVAGTNSDTSSYVVADCFTHAHTNSDCSVWEYQNLSDYRWAMGTGAEFEQFAAGRHYLYRRSRFNDQWY